MTEQLNIFEFEKHEENFNLVTSCVQVLREKGFDYILPLGTGKGGYSAYRGMFENKPCTIHIDDGGNIMFKHDDSRFYDYFGEI
ncbi:hypothetical protein [Bacillus toyonensis]|uniref:hypothetical protein n=1 Tax=Bacillus toyonensis TaxID=155322 RepID=UPI00027BEA56|nr:hypothetical protein [Bacillus toyonensis]EJV41754.1 hypothetical protein IEA_05639 [Bacillus toyonensis]